MNDCIPIKLSIAPIMDSGHEASSRVAPNWFITPTYITPDERTTPKNEEAERRKRFINFLFSCRVNPPKKVKHNAC